MKSSADNRIINADKEALLDLLLEEEGYVPARTTSIIPMEKAGPHPLSFAQQRLYFLDQLEPNNPAYNIPAALNLSGEMKLAALERALGDLVRRHPALRTVFTTEMGRPVQIVRPPAALPLPVIDLSHLAPADRKTETQRLTTAEARRPFDLVTGLLLRASLLRLNRTEHLLLLIMHHIISDGWSMAIFTRELAALYAARAAGVPTSLPELPLQYTDFAHWQRQQLTGDRLKRELAYWQQQLKDAPLRLNLPADHPRSPVQTYRGRRQTFSLPASLTRALKALGRQEGVTLFMTLLAAFKVLLYRYTGQTDIVVGSPIANRSRTELEALIGCFINTLVLRTDLSGRPSFRQLLRRVYSVTLGTYQHQDLPFEMLVDALQPERDLSYPPFFQIMFVLQNAAAAPTRAANLRFTPTPVESGTAKFDLTLELLENEDALICNWEYNTDLFEPASIRRMAGHFQRLLEAIVSDPERSIANLPLLTEAERQQLWPDRKRLTTGALPGRSIHRIFEARAAKTPEATALSYQGQQLSYGQLNRQANQLAHYLQSLGVRAESPVGLYLERSPELVIAILGILKAGGAYVPLDPVNPAQRLDFILADAQISVVLTQQSLLDNLHRPGVRFICLDRDWPEMAHQPAENLDSGVQAANLAYIIYTSGSTGRPKGALIDHHNVTRLFEAAAPWFHFAQNDVWTLFHSYAFDFSVWEMWGALFYGGRLVIVPYWVSRSPEAFFRLLAQERVTVLNQTPSAFYQLIYYEDQAGTAPDLALRLVIFGGEALELNKLRSWFDRHGDQNPRLVNMYGITETTVHVTCRPLSRADLEAGLGSVIGRPLPDLQLYLLDQQRNLVPVGVPGELYVGGAGLARGYLNRPRLTAERFTPPVGEGDRPGRRLYKTGDLVRYRANGDLEYLGRIDHQVKIRGFRIELGEIEVALNRHPRVRESVVLAQADNAGHKRLAAYVVPARNRVDGEQADLDPRPTGGPQDLISELRGFLEGELPAYMIPAAFVRLDALPLTPNGKIDRRALPVPDAGQLERPRSFIRARTPVEEVLARIWAEVLGLKQVGIYDNFFELGGDSILTLQIIARARQAGLYLTPKQLFQQTSIAALAAVAGVAPTPKIEQGPVTGPAPLTAIQRWFFEQDLPEPHHWNQSILLELSRPLDDAHLKQVIGRLLLHHDALRLRFKPGQSGWKQVSPAPDEEIPFSQIDLSSVPETAQAAALRAALADLQSSLNLSQGPLLRVALLDFGPDRPGRLFIVIHHLIVDGVSWRILLEDLQTACGQLSRGQAISLSPKTSSFKQWAEAVTDYAGSATLRKEADYWLSVVRANGPDLPLDFPAEAAANTEDSARTIAVSLTAAQTQSLLQRVPAAYHTQINDALLTALLQAFAGWTGEPKLLLDLEGHGREEIVEGLDLGRTVGWFTTIFPVYLQLEEGLDPGQALKSIKEQLCRIPQRGLGYGLLRYLHGDPTLAAELRLQPQVIFNYLGQFDQVAVPGSPFGPDFGLVKSGRSPLGSRRYLLSIDGYITGGQLYLVWSYSRNFHRAATIKRLARDFIERLQSLIGHCQSPRAGGYTPSDFPQMKFSQAELDALLEDLDSDPGAVA